MTGNGAWAVVPVKDFALAKGRLAPVLGPDQRWALSRAMLEDVLSVLARVEELAGVVVVTRDSNAETLAARYGARVLPEPDTEGLNAAVTATAEALSIERAPAMLYVPGDVPLVAPDDIATVLDAVDRPRAAALVPARDGHGTNALLCAPPGAIDFRFGEDSFPRHLSAARAAGMTARAVTCPGLSLDIDEPDDLRLFLRSDRDTRTARYLRTGGIARRLSQAAPPRKGTGDVQTLRQAR